MELCHPNGRVAMVTMQSWMFLSSYANLRLLDRDKLKNVSKGVFKGLLLEVAVEAIAHLGSRAFDPDNKFHDGVAVVLFVLMKHPAQDTHKILACRLEGMSGPSEKSEQLRRFGVDSSYQYVPTQLNFASIVGSPLSYWLDNVLLAKFAMGESLSSVFIIKGGLSTTDNDRFVRYNWETGSVERWPSYTKGGGYNRWAGNNYYAVEWEFSGSRMKEYIVTIPGNNHWSRRIFNS